MEACTVASTSLFTIFFIIVSTFVDFSNADAVNTTALYIFGDSFVDVGNNNYLYKSRFRANFPPNGIDFPTKQPNGRFSNGKNTADFLAEAEKVPSPQPFLSLVTKVHNEKDAFAAGVNFASGGAGIFNDSDVRDNQALHFGEQVHYFSQVCAQLEQHLGPNATKVHLQNALTVIFIGNVDIQHYLTSPVIRKKYTPDQYVNDMLTSFEKHLQKIYSLGARRFLILGTVPVGCLPLNRNSKGECNKLGNSMCEKFQYDIISLREKLEELTGRNSPNIDFARAYSMLLGTIEKPFAYGFKEGKAACCGGGYLNAELPCKPGSYVCPNRNEHIFWDQIHLTEEAHRKLVNDTINY